VQRKLRLNAIYWKRNEYVDWVRRKGTTSTMCTSSSHFHDKIHNEYADAMTAKIQCTKGSQPHPQSISIQKKRRKKGKKEDSRGIKENVRYMYSGREG